MIRIKFVSIYIYTCGEEIKTWKAYKCLKQAGSSKNIDVMEMQIGIINTNNNDIKIKRI